MAKSSVFQSTGTNPVAATTAAAELDAFKIAAEAAQAAAETAQAAAETAETDAQTAESNASASATSASSSASSAASSASSASTSATNAATSATNASNSASLAATSESNASTSETNASTSETNASNSASAASTSATNAATSATNASTSETNASTSATNAATSATNAATSETNAATSATSAATAQTAAETAKTAAETAKTASETAQTAAEAAQTAAETAETNAGTSETNAATSATNAASSASAAASSASAASTSATSASSSLTSFQDVYRTGTTDPTTDLDTGDLFYNTSSGLLKVYNGSAWEQGVTAGSGFLALSGGALTGNVTTTGTFDGRDVAADGTKLDGIEANADVTDTTNVVAALTAGSDISIAADGTIAYTGASDLVSDTTPQLGGNLDTNGNDINFGDNDKAVFGAGSDLQIYHDGNNSLINDVGTGDLRLRSNGSGVIVEMSNGNDLAQFLNGSGEAKLMHNGSEKLATTSSGIDVTGTVTADDLKVDGTDDDVQFNDTSLTKANLVKYIGFHGSDGRAGYLGYSGASGAGSFQVYNQNNSAMTFHNNSSEAMRIDSSGNLLVSTTDTNPTNDSETTFAFVVNKANHQVRVRSNNLSSLRMNRTGTDGEITQFYKDGSQVGSISTTSGDIEINSASGNSKNVDIIGRDSGGNARGIAVGSGSVRPNAGNAIDLGTSSNRFKDLYLTGIDLNKGSAGSLATFTDGISTNFNFSTSGAVGSFGTDAGSTSLALKTAGSERMRIDSSGQVMIGTTTAGGQFTVTEGDATTIIDRVGTNVAGIKTGSGDDFCVGTADFNQAIRIKNNSGNVGIGTTSPQRPLVVSDAGTEGFEFQPGSASGQNTLNHYNRSTASFVNILTNADQHIFGRADGEKVRIDSSGNLLVGKTVTSLNTDGIRLKGNDTANFTVNGGAVLDLNRRSSDGNLVNFYRDASTRGSITVNSSGTTYNTTSDRRLKTDIQPIADATDKLMRMQPVTHKWIAEPDGDAVHGFIAQDMQQICPEAVSGEDGGEEMMSMDYGRITPVLVAALQEANRKIDQLEQRIAEMENN